MSHQIDTERILHLLREEERIHHQELMHDSGLLISKERGEMPCWRFLPDKKGIEKPCSLFNDLKAMAQIVEGVDREGNPCFVTTIDTMEDHQIHTSLSDWMAGFDNAFGDGCGHNNVKHGEVHLYVCSRVKPVVSDARMLKRIKNALWRDGLLLCGLHNANHHEQELDEHVPVERFLSPAVVNQMLH